MEEEKRDRIKPPRKRKRGGQFVEFNEEEWKLLDFLLGIHTPQKEIAAVFGIHPQTLVKAVEREKGMIYSLYEEEQQAPLKMRVRQKILSRAMHGSDSMLKMLANNWLGYSDKIRHEVEIPGQSVGFSAEEAEKIMSNPEAQRLSREMSLLLTAPQERDAKEIKDGQDQEGNSQG